MVNPSLESADLDRAPSPQPERDPPGGKTPGQQSQGTLQCEMEAMGEADLAPCVRAWLNGEAVPI